MVWFKKKDDPLSAKARALSDQIAALESEIKVLDSQLNMPAGPKLRSSISATGQPLPLPPEPFSPQRSTPRAPGFIPVKAGSLKETPPAGPAPVPPELLNEFGYRRYDLPGAWQRWREYLRGPTTGNPDLVHLLAAGGVEGVRPLRHEKREARTRFFWFSAVLFVILSLIVFHICRNR